MEIKSDVKECVTVNYSIQDLQALLDKLVASNNQLVGEFKKLSDRYNSNIPPKLMDRISNLENQMENAKSKTNLHDIVTNKHEDTISRMESTLSKMGENVDLLMKAYEKENDISNSALQEYIKKLDAKIVLFENKIANFTSIMEHMTNENAKVMANEKNHVDSQKNINDHLSKLEHIVENKVDTEDVNKLYQAIINIQNNFIEKIKAAESSQANEPKLLRADLKNLSDKFGDLQKFLKDINLEDMKEKVDLLDSKANNLMTMENDVNNLKTQLEELQFKLPNLNLSKANPVLENALKLADSVNKDLKEFKKQYVDDQVGIKGNIEQIENDLNEFKDKILKDSLNIGGSGSFDPRMFKYALENDLKQMKEDIAEVKSKFMIVDSLNEKMPQKAFLSDLERLRKDLLYSLDGLLEKIDGKYAKLADTRNNFRILDQKIKMLKYGKPTKEKPKNDYCWNCASCEKMLVNLQTQPAEYYIWKKMPTRYPIKQKRAEGYSKLLSLVKPGDLNFLEPTNSVQESPNQNQASRDSDSNEIIREYTQRPLTAGTNLRKNHH